MRVTLHPFHQGRADSLPLMCRIDCEPADMQIPVTPLKTQASQRLCITPSQPTSMFLEVSPNVLLGFFQCPARRIQPAVAGKGQLRQPV